jgi:2-amino-4-hydroxy-6-hydroxymethyldihydropteridine diphosphokinase
VPETLIALGANLSDKSQVLHEAVECLVDRPGVQLAAMSEVIETFPIGVPDSEATFLNAAARFEVELEPEVWLETLLETERQLGRERSVRWGARKIDLDLLLYGQEVICSRPLWVPHPRMAFRRFVMQPAVEVGSEMWHPLCGSPLSQVWEFLNREPNLIVWLLAEDEHQALVSQRLFHHDVLCRWVGDLDEFESVVRESTRYLATGPIQGAGAASVLCMVSPQVACRQLRRLLEDQGLRPKLVIRATESQVWFEDSPSPLDRPPRIELVLDSDDPQRIQQEVVGAIESMLVL